MSDLSGAGPTGPYWFILDENKQPVPVSIEVASPWLADPLNKVIAQTRFEDETLVSTVFLGLDHNHRFSSANRERPVLWESMAFFPANPGGKQDEWCMRYSSHAAALLGHKAMVALVQSRETGMGRALLLDWDEAWKMALIKAEIDDEDTES